MDNPPEKFLTRDELLGLDVAKRRRYVAHRFAGATVVIRSLTEQERSQFEASLVTRRGGVDVDRLASAKRRLICLCLCGEDKQPLFRPDEAHLLADFDGREIGQLYDACRRHVGLDEGDIEKSIETAAKN